MAQPAPAVDKGEEAYQAGRRHYDLREWDKAIEKFKEAYKIRSDGPSLFNIAQSYRLKGDCVEALGFYKTYRRNFSTAPNIDKVDAFIIELEPCAKERAKAGPATTEPTEKSDPGPHPEPTLGLGYEDRGAGKRKAGLVVGGIGVALVGTGFLFGVIAKGKADDVSGGGNVDMPPEFNPDVETSGKRFDLFAKISWGVGGAALIGGVVMYMMGKSAEQTVVTLSVVPTRDGAAFAWGHRF